MRSRRVVVPLRTRPPRPSRRVAGRDGLESRLTLERQPSPLAPPPLHPVTQPLELALTLGPYDPSLTPVRDVNRGALADCMSKRRRRGTRAITALNDTSSADQRSTTRARSARHCAGPWPTSSTTARPSTAPSTLAPVSPSIRCSRRSSPSRPAERADHRRDRYPDRDRPAVTTRSVSTLTRPHLDRAARARSSRFARFAASAMSTVSASNRRPDTNETFAASTSATAAPPKILITPVVTRPWNSARQVAREIRGRLRCRAGRRSVRADRNRSMRTTPADARDVQTGLITEAATRRACRARLR